MLISVKHYRGLSGLMLLGAVGAIAAVGCGNEFSSCMETRTCRPPSIGAEGGGSGEAGNSEVIAGSEASGGRDTGNGNSGGESQGGSVATAGAGEGGEPTVLPPEEGEPCSDNGALRCVGPAQKVSQICEAGAWATAVICKADENCDQSSGACGSILAECKGKIGGQLYCGSDDTVFACGPDLVSTEEAEACDGNCVDSDASASCAPITCGDGKIQAPEECDDGNKDQTDGCTNACKEAACGDGSTWAGNEACDDGNAKDDDACTAACKPATCGDGFVWVGKETCDDKNKVDTDACTNACQKAICGDGILQAGKEECDDKNAVSGDGCSKTCTVEPVQIVGFDYRFCTLGANGKIRCFGFGLEDWDSFDVKLAASEKAISIAASGPQLATLCAIMQGGAVRCWGSNNSGKLGAETVDERALTEPAPNLDLGTNELATSLSVGGRHACAVVSNGKVKCWGDNRHGQLGHTPATPDEIIGDEPGEMGQNLVVVPETEVRKVRSVVAGSVYTCIHREDGTMRCWGDRAPGSHTAGLEMSLGAVLTISQASAGGGHACAVLTNNQMKCWGQNSGGQLGQDDIGVRNTAATMGNNLLPIKLGVGRTPKYIFAGDTHSCAILDSGSLKCWGYNPLGLLGSGDNAPIGDAPGEMAALKPVELGTGRIAKQLAFSSTTACALLTDGRVTCWGNVNTPMLEFLGDEPGEMGDRLPIVPLQF